MDVPDFIFAVNTCPHEGTPLLHLEKVIVSFVGRDKVPSYDGAGISVAVRRKELLIQKMTGAKVLQKLRKILLEVLKPSDKFILLGTYPSDIFIAESEHKIDVELPIPLPAFLSQADKLRFLSFQREITLPRSANSRISVYIISYSSKYFKFFGRMTE